jgi:hypothetical protein
LQTVTCSASINDACHSYLTRRALDCVERDRHVLGKVDRDDLDLWIDRTLRGT